MSFKNWSEDTKRQAVREIEGGKDLAEVADELDVDRRTLGRWQQKYGVAAEQPVRPTEDQVRERARDLLKDPAVSIKSVQKALEVEGLGTVLDTTVRAWRRELEAEPAQEVQAQPERPRPAAESVGIRFNFVASPELLDLDVPGRIRALAGEGGFSESQIGRSLVMLGLAAVIREPSLLMRAPGELRRALGEKKG